jgi:hypothetical protein
LLAILIVFNHSLVQATVWGSRLCCGTPLIRLIRLSSDWIRSWTQEALQIIDVFEMLIIEILYLCELILSDCLEIWILVHLSRCRSQMIFFPIFVVELHATRKWEIIRSFSYSISELRIFGGTSLWKVGWITTVIILKPS